MMDRVQKLFPTDKGLKAIQSMKTYAAGHQLSQSDILKFYMTKYECEENHIFGRTTCSRQAMHLLKGLCTVHKIQLLLMRLVFVITCTSIYTH